MNKSDEIIKELKKQNKILKELLELEKGKIYHIPYMAPFHIEPVIPQFPYYSRPYTGDPPPKWGDNTGGVQ